MTAAVADAAGITTMTTTTKTPRGGSGGKAAAPESMLGSASVQLLPLARVHPDPRNRAGDPLDDITELADSIRELGLLQPLIVRPREDGDWDLVAGHRRRAALLLIGEAAAACSLCDLEPAQAIAARLVENLHRSDLTPVQEAAGLKELADLGHSQRAIAKMIGKTQPHVSRRLALLELPEQVQAAVVTETLSLEQAREVKDFTPAQLEQVIGPAAPAYQSTDSRIRLVRQAEERAQVVAAEQQRIRAEGLQLVETVPRNGILTGFPLCDRITVTAHAKLPCHAIWIADFGTVRRVPVCTKPTSHPAKERKETAAEKRTRLEHERLRAEQAAAQEAEARALAEVLAGKPDKQTDNFIDQVMFELLGDAYGVEVYDLLEDLDLAKADEQQGPYERDPYEVLEAYAAKNAAQLRRVLLAGALRYASGSGATPPARTALQSLLTARGGAS